MSKKFVTNFRSHDFDTQQGKFTIKEEPVTTPLEDDFGDHYRLDYPFENEFGTMKKSMSMNDIATLKYNIEMENQTNRDDIYERYTRPSGGPQELSKTKFVSMAESIYHYQRDTPCRFRSTRQTFRPRDTEGPSGLTIPQSPNLRCKGRARSSHILSQKEKEEMELEKIKKFKIKPRCVPISVIEGSKNIPKVLQKPITVPEPFNLTEPHKKPLQTLDKFMFKARAVPKHILDKPQIPVRLPVQTNKSLNFELNCKPSCFNIEWGKTKAIHHKSTEKTQCLGPIKPEPFSFEKRNKEMKHHKEQWIMQQIEEERKMASQFKAQPVPNTVKKQILSVTSKQSGSSTTSSENKENHIKFEARQPVVLYKEPFKPTLKPTQLVKPVPFDLATEKRATDRDKFERHLKVKEEEQQIMRQQKEKEIQEAEENAKAELRAKLVHHAKPAPAAQPFIPEKLDLPLTVPETPKVLKRSKQQ